jgi:hypothetical protein
MEVPLQYALFAVRCQAYPRYELGSFKNFITLKMEATCSTETSALTRLRVFENRVLKRIFGPNRYGVTGGWRKLHNEELRDLYSSPSIIRIIKPKSMRWAGHVVRMGEKRNVYRLLVGKPEGGGPLGRPRRRWMDNIKMDPVEIG